MASSGEGAGNRAASISGSLLSPALLASWRGRRLCIKPGLGVGEPRQVTAGPAALVQRPECLLPQELLPLPDHKLYEGRDWLANSCCTPRAQLRVVQTIDCGLLVARESNATEQQMSEPATHDMVRHVQLQ